MWLELASHLNTPLQEVQKKTSSSELLVWSRFLRKKKEDEYQSHTKIEYYYACILAEIRRSFVKEPRKVNWENFLLKFDLKNPEKKPKEDWKSRMEKSKSAWGAILGGFSSKKGKNGK